MKRLTLIVIMMVSLLTAWGEEPTFDLEKTKQEITELDSLTNEVQIQALNITGMTVEKFGKVPETFAEAEIILNEYPNLTPDLQKEAAQNLQGFISEYSKAIYNKRGTKVAIESDAFLKVADRYEDKFEEILEKAYPKDPQPATTTVATPANDTAAGLPKGPTTADNGDKTDLQEKKGIETEVLVMLIVALVTGVIGLLLGAFAMIRMKRYREELDVLQNRIKTLETSREPAPAATVNNKQPKRSAYRGPAYTQPQTASATQVLTPQGNPGGAYSNPPAIPAQGQNKRQEPKAPEKPVKTALYATANVKKPTEFTKVTEDNKGDKAFRLMLPAPESDTAEVTIAPDMTSDFLKAVIDDRDTYIPSTVCEILSVAPNPTRIKVRSTGRAVKTNGTWQIKDRVQVDLI